MGGARTRHFVGMTVAGFLCLSGALRSETAVSFDCLAGAQDCPQVQIEGDPWFEIPGFGPSPFRGYGDPAVRKDPKSDRLWMTYSYLSVVSGSGNPPPIETTVSIHLASSDDNGLSWQFRRRLWPAGSETDPSPAGGSGVSVHEVSTLTSVETAGKPHWYAMHLRYFEPFGPEGRRPQSFHFLLGRSRRPKRVAKGRQARIGGPLTDSAWGTDLDLSSVDPEITECALWTEPSLFGSDGRLYLVAQCLVFDSETGKRRRRREFIGVFRADSARPDRLEWQWLGKLTTRSEAKALGGHVLTQPEVTTGRDGSLLLLVTPKRLTPSERHLGCRALELQSLDPPRLGRKANGKPAVRADIRSSDSTGLGPGLCSYHPALDTGVLLVRTEVDLDLPEVIFRMHATGVHP